MTFPDITPDLKAAMPQLRGRLLANQSLAELTWFRVGGPAQVLFTPADEDDLAYFLKLLPKQLPVYVVGVGSNLIVRDGGMAGVVIRLSPRAFGETSASARTVTRGIGLPRAAAPTARVIESDICIIGSGITAAMIAEKLDRIEEILRAQWPEQIDSDALQASGLLRDVERARTALLTSIDLEALL